MLLVTFFLALCVYLYLKLRKNLTYWEEKGVKYVKPLPIFGNMLPLVRQSKTTSGFIQDLYNSFPDQRYCGIFQFSSPILVIRDPELIKTLSIKSFDHFTDHAGFIDPEVDPLWGKNLFSSEGERWRDLRQTISPVFTSSKMRMMFMLMDECARRFVDHFKAKPEAVVEIEMKNVSNRYANDVIATTAFGLKCDSMDDENNEFMVMGRELTDMSGWNRFKFMLYGSYPTLVKVLGLKLVNDRIGNFFTSIIKETIRVREEKKIVRPDLIHLLMEARKGKLSYEDRQDLPETGFATAQESELGRNKNGAPAPFLTDVDISAQALVFFFGGFDTASSLLSFCSYELAINPDVQAKLREEIKAVTDNCGGKITYEALLGMKYLDMVLCEALRMWSQGVFLDRKCTKAFTIAPEKKGEQPVTLNVGDVCWVPVSGIHRDPQYYPNPDVFDPERFNDENKAKINPYTYLPFGIGPRNCIGSRFALLENKTLIFYLLQNFEIVPTKKTTIPLKLSKNSFTMVAENGIHLGFKQIV